MIILKKFLLFFLSFLIIFNFSFGYILYAGSGNGEGGIYISEESNSNLEAGGDEKDNWKNTFWYGKVEEIDGKFGISIC